MQINDLRRLMSNSGGRFLVKSIASDDGSMLMGYTRSGHCPMFVAGNCSIYSRRPITCGQFDCRILAAAGCELDGRWSERVNERVRRWQFSHASEHSQALARSVKAAAAFMANNARLFPGDRVPTDPLQLSILALKVHPVFLSGAPSDPAATARRIVSASRQFDAGHLFAKAD
jgi:Fe-S-cluster containining protein